MIMNHKKNVNSFFIEITCFLLFNPYFSKISNLQFLSSPSACRTSGASKNPDWPDINGGHWQNASFRIGVSSILFFLKIRPNTDDFYVYFLCTFCLHYQVHFFVCEERIFDLIKSISLWYKIVQWKSHEIHWSIGK